MSSVVLNGDSSGSVTLTVPSAAGSNTATIPASTGNVLLDSTVGVCKAWVSFQGVTTATVNASFNVSSVTRNQTGVYTVTYTNALSDTNYAVLANGRYATAGTYGQNPTVGVVGNNNNASTPATGSCQIGVNNDAGTVQDAYTVYFAAFR